MKNKNTLIFGFFKLHVQLDGSVRMFGIKGRSFTGNADCSGATPTLHKSVDAAILKAKEWSIYQWNNNDRLYLIREYGITQQEVREFLGYTWPIEKGAECDCCDSWINYETGLCDCDGMREMLEAGLEMSGTK